MINVTLQPTRWWVTGPTVPTLATKKIRARPWVVGYGAGCRNTGYEVEDEGKPAPNIKSG
ncbi:hypothetical protein LYNGBM3L_01380 [Moorena producens 3L]|uniref:Uncharacterized protein n=1 Tax=Moorena producens 3L TaxID=489825 RepID=F4XIE6_9CYAN|nr:hypothetical protein LYNGBM3L_01380 [Moorena producens 3L]